METIKAIVIQLEEWNKNYRKGEPSVPDSIYDYELSKLPKDHPYRNTVEPEVLYKGRIKHSKPMLSMQKAKTREDIEKWINTILNKTKILPKFITIRCSAKLDGIAGKYEEFKFTTRGDGVYGNDVTNSIDKGVIFNNKIMKDTICSQIMNSFNPILGEFVVKLDYFKENLSIKFSHPRNFVSGAIISDTVSSITNKAFIDSAIVFQAYSDLPHNGCSLDSLLDRFREFEKEISESVNYAIDGVIFEVVNPIVKSNLGETDSYPNWAIALKPKDKIYTSIIIDILWQTGRSGKVTPVVIIEPTMIDGVEVRRATAHNAKMVETMGLKIGAKIELIRSGSVIPYIVKVVD